MNEDKTNARSSLNDVTQSNKPEDTQAEWLRTSMLKSHLIRICLTLLLTQYICIAEENRLAYEREEAERKRNALIDIVSPTQLTEDTLLIDKAGFVRWILLVQSDGKYWMSHKNSRLIGTEKTYDQLRSNKIVPVHLREQYEKRALRNTKRLRRKMREEGNLI